MQARFASRIQLAKADKIPVCDDIVATSFQVLHFDMGIPLVESENQMYITHVGLYLPPTTDHEITASTRIVELAGLLNTPNINPNLLENNLVEYVKNHGDGWENNNTLRLACFARFLDAALGTRELAAEIDKTVGQFFNTDKRLSGEEAYSQESLFYGNRGINIKAIERQIKLKPGQLLVIDNSRVIHGRIGQRKAKEVYNFMFGVQSISHDDIRALRRYTCNLISSYPSVASK